VSRGFLSLAVIRGSRFEPLLSPPERQNSWSRQSHGKKRLMATYLFAWELGLGLGHLVNLRPLVHTLAARGHRVHLALRELERAPAVFAGAQIALWQAPFKSRRTSSAAVTPTLSFPQLLAEAGFASPIELAGLAAAWRSILHAVRPDVIVFDHSPTALLAARSFAAKRVTLGTGFFLPLDEAPLECIQPWLHPDPVRLAADEQHVLNVINTVLAQWHEPPIARVASLYHPADEHLLVTFPELDHYTRRTGAKYWGAWSIGFGKPPEWPAGSGKKVYAYLKPFRELPVLLAELRKAGCPTVIYCDGVPQQLRGEFQCPTIRFEDEPLDMNRVSQECDLAILNGNHGTTVQILLAGKPSLQIPVHVEQSLLINALIRLGAALGAAPDSASGIQRQLEILLTSDRCTESARAFSAKYAGFNPQAQIAGIVGRLEALAAGGA
jgi:hypothetical protein